MHAVGQLIHSIESELISGNVGGALEIAEQAAVSQKALLAKSSDFLTVAARVCIQTRKWTLGRILSSSAIESATFGSSETRHWAFCVFAYTRGIEVMLSVQNRFSPPEWRAQVSEVLSLFRAAVDMDVPGRGIGLEFAREWMMLITGHCQVPEEVFKVLQSAFSDLNLLSAKGGGAMRMASFRSAQRIRDLSALHQWHPLVDAQEIGNEARYMNHADFPNAMLVSRDDTALMGHRIPFVVAIRSIDVGDEITVNYGGGYWCSRSSNGSVGATKHERKRGSVECLNPSEEKDYSDSSTSAGDPLMFGLSLKDPFSDCVYYNGFVYDHGCSMVPSGFLIPPNASLEKLVPDAKNFCVKQVSPVHPAFPGFGLFAKQKFEKGDQLCIYAGVVDCSPYSVRHLSHYAMDLGPDNPIGPFGLYWDPVALECCETQFNMPYVSPFEDISIYPERSECVKILRNLKSIRGIDDQTTKSVASALLLPGYRDLVRQRLNSVKQLPQNANPRDVQLFASKVKKYFDEILSKPPPGLVKRVKLGEADPIINHVQEQMVNPGVEPRVNHVQQPLVNHVQEPIVNHVPDPFVKPLVKASVKAQAGDQSVLPCVVVIDDSDDGEW